jgi:hypothetical protein
LHKILRFPRFTKEEKTAESSPVKAGGFESITWEINKTGRFEGL